jgi:hypothetical protein
MLLAVVGPLLLPLQVCEPGTGLGVLLAVVVPLLLSNATIAPSLSVGHGPPHVARGPGLVVAAELRSTCGQQ